MASIAVCPHCTSHLELPEDAYATAHLQCPLCDGEFELAAASARALPQARLLPPATATSDELAEIAAHEIPTADAAIEVTPADRLAQLLSSTSQWRPSPGLPPALVPTAVVEGTSPDRIESAPSDIPATELPSPPIEESNSSSGNTSRLDQLLSDLMKTAPQLSVPLAPTVDVTEQAEMAASEPIESPVATSVEETATAAFGSGVYEVADDTVDTHEEAEFEYAADFEPDEQEDDLEPAYPAATSDHAESSVAFEPRNVQRKRPPSAVRSLVGIVGGGVLGILLGGYGLLWLRGPEGDLMGLTRWLPASWLPPSARIVDGGTAAQLAAAPRTAEEPNDDAEAVEQREPSAGELNADDEPRGWEATDAAAEVPTRFDSSIAPATAIEPVTTETPPQATPVTTIWPATEIIADLRDAKLYSLTELDEALSVAESAQQRFIAGDLSQRESVAGMGQAYIELCALAERFTLTDPAAFGNQLVTKQLAAKTVFRATVADPARRNDLAIVAGRWLQHDRRQNQGVVLTGKVSDIRARGRWTEHVIAVGTGEASVQAAVLMEEIRFDVGAQAAVVGVIIGEPQKHLAGYDGDSPQLVLASFNFDPGEAGVSESADLSGGLWLDVGNSDQ